MLTDEELWAKVLIPGMRRLKMKELLKRASEGEGRIVCSGDLTENQIAEARVEGRMTVTEDSLGWVLLPWDLTTQKDRARERAYGSALCPGAETKDERGPDGFFNRPLGDSNPF